MSTTTFNTEQKQYLEHTLKNMSSDCIQKIMEDEDEDMNDEKLQEILESVFHTRGFKFEKSKASKKTSTVKPFKESNAFKMWFRDQGKEFVSDEFELSDDDEIVEKSKELWSEMSSKKHSEYKTYGKFNELTKKPANAYLLWFKEEGRSFIEEEYELTVYREVTVKAGEIWSEYKSEDNDIFKKYTEKYEEFKAQYDEMVSSLSSKKVATKKSGGGKAVRKSEGTKTTKSKASSQKSKSTTVDLGSFKSFDELSEPKPSMFIRKMTDDNKSETFETLDEAVEAMKDDDEAMAIMMDKKGKYTLRGSQNMVAAKASQTPCMVWLRNMD